MSRAFEEIVGGELDALYQGALFLAAGDALAAERLLIDTVTRAYREHAHEPEVPPLEAWLEGVLVQTFLSAAPSAPEPGPQEHPARSSVADHGPTVGPVEPEALHRGARALPAQARAGLWLVLLRRWGYDRAAEALGVERAVLVELLGYRDAFMREVLSSAGSRSGPDHARNRA